MSTWLMSVLKEVWSLGLLENGRVRIMQITNYSGGCRSSKSEVPISLILSRVSSRLLELTMLCGRVAMVRG